MTTPSHTSIPDGCEHEKSFVLCAPYESQRGIEMKCNLCAPTIEHIPGIDFDSDGYAHCVCVCVCTSTGLAWAHDVCARWIYCECCVCGVTSDVDPIEQKKKKNHHCAKFPRSNISLSISVWVCPVPGALSRMHDLEFEFLARCRSKTENWIILFYWIQGSRDATFFSHWMPSAIRVPFVN